MEKNPNDYLGNKISAIFWMIAVLVSLLIAMFAFSVFLKSCHKAPDDPRTAHRAFLRETNDKVQEDLVKKLKLDNVSLSETLKKNLAWVQARKQSETQMMAQGNGVTLDPVFEEKPATNEKATADVQTEAEPEKVEIVELTPEEIKASRERGVTVYNTPGSCVTCHQANGEGLPGVFPPLIGSEWVSGDPKLQTAIILKGLQGPIEVKGQKYMSAMAPLAHLTDEQIADVLTYVRSEWGNDSPAVTVPEVTATRKEFQTKMGMWTAEELKKVNLHP